MMVPLIRMSFKPWLSAHLEEVYPGKTVLDFNGEPVFPELAVLRSFEAKGFKGVWVNRHQFRVGLPGIVDPVCLPAAQRSIFDKIKKHAGSGARPWDVFLWKGKDVRFLALKGHRRDPYGSALAKWLESSMALGLSRDQFSFVEWDDAGGAVSLMDKCQEAMSEGKKIDLNMCRYGEPHWQGAVPTDPFAYYYFLAGLVRTQHLKYIFEIGTHFGGSIMAMSRGVPEADFGKSRLVTVDLTYLNADVLKTFPSIKRIKGDALSTEVVQAVARSFDRPVDLMYIDSSHSYEHVRPSIDIYMRKLDPRYIVLDDIALNPSMKRLWQELCVEHEGCILDISAITSRGKSVGFGIIERVQARTKGKR